ncbi:MAG: glycosyltransferase family 2 protein [Sulfurimonas sp.]|nr:glycosyltransferase family 2 protein [Sulfurimonas sp.]
MNISAVIIVKNGAASISRTLDALKEFSDVVVFDNGSSDGTQDIAKRYANVNLIEGDFIGFGPTKNKAASYAKNDWIIIIDSDEVVDNELLNTLKTKVLDKNRVYSLNFIAYYKEIQIKHCGWSNQKIKRVYNKTVTKFNDNLVHENIIDTNPEHNMLDGNIKHYSYTSISDFIIKIDRYSSLFANDNVGKKNSSPTKAIFNGIFSFIKTYFLKRGFLDGYAGLVIAFSHMATNFYKYIKLYELNKDKKQNT